MSKIEININPEVLKWARDERGYSVEEISKKLSIEEERYLEWETTGKRVPFGKLKNIAAYYKRQIAVFFLEDVPEPMHKPKDFRNLNVDQRTLSKKVKLALRRALYFQNLSSELGNWDKRYDWLEGVDQLDLDDNVQVGGWVRSILGLDIDTQVTWKNDNEAYRFWRNQIENELGILIFQFPMPIDEVHGFCLTDTKPFVIVTNSYHSYTARSFTLFHELAHILRNHSGICLTDKLHSRESQNEEWSCNSLAGEVLIPSKQLIRTSDINEIYKYASKFKVSREAYLRRLKEENAIPDVLFFKHLEAIKSTYKKDKKRGKGGPTHDRVIQASRGSTYYNIVLDAVRSDKISFTEGSRFLGISVKKLVNEF